MRTLRFLPFLLLLPAGAVPIHSNKSIAPYQGQAVAQASMAAPRELELGPEERLSLLYRALASSGSPEEAARFEGEIFLIMAANPSPTITLLMEAAVNAAQNEDMETARGALQSIGELDPNFAEGQARLAAIAYQDGDFAQATVLLHRALALEPRHFAAWAGLGLVLEDQGDYRGAQDAYREALFLHPYLDSAKRGLIRMDTRLDGLSL
jgi:tetratricopeptide (TPR) repeat protein